MLQNILLLKLLTIIESNSRVLRAEDEIDIFGP
jgi:hypothetical protein